MKYSSRVLPWVAGVGALAGFGVGWLLKLLLWRRHQAAEDEMSEGSEQSGLLGDVSRADQAWQIERIQERVTTLLEEYERS